MPHKTKAAITGRHCYYSEGSSAVQGILTFVCSSCIRKHHRKLFAAGGQSLSAPVIKGTAALAHTPFPQIWGEQDQPAGCTAMQHTPEESRSFDRYPDNGYHSLLASLAFLRWRRLISPCIAELINCPVLSPGFFTDSIPSMISCAIRAVTDCDFAFFEPVAMSTFSKTECKTLYTKKYYLEVLTCKTPVAYCVSYTLFELRCVNSNAPDCWSSTEASNHNVRWSNIMACIQHTQTRPEFTWRFLSTSERYPNAKPLVIYVNASSEQEARDTMPGVNLIFAARLPFHAFQAMEVHHA